MGTYCTINPRVRSEKTGELVDSKLFSDLKKSVGYANARKVYLKVRDEDFINEYDEELSKDENGEYTISSLESIPELTLILGSRARKTYAASEAGAYSPVVATKENILEAERRAIEYNSKPGNEYIALPEIYENNSGTEVVQVRMVENTIDNREKASQISRKRVLASRMSSVLQSLGIDPQVVDVLLDKLRGNGMDEYDAMLGIANGILGVVNRAHGGDMEVVNSDLNADIIYMALWDNPIMKRLVSAVYENGLIDSILSEGEIQAISHDVEDRNLIVSESAVARLIGDYFLNGSVEDINQRPELQPVKMLMRRLYDVFSDLFSTIEEREIASYIKQAELTETDKKFQAELGEEEFILNEVVDTEEHKKATNTTKKVKNLLFELIETNVKRYKILSANDVKYNKSFDKNLTANLYEKYQDSEYELGIFEFIDATLEQLGNVEERLREVAQDDKLSIERRASILKSIKDFIQSYELSVNAIRNAEFHGYIKPSKERIDALNQASYLVGKLMADYEDQKNPLLVAYVKRFIGEGLEIPFGKEKGRVITAEEILSKAEKDITVFDRWLDSMAESGDIMLRMLDSTAKKARNSARLNTIEYKKRADAIYLKLKKVGITDTSFIYQKDENGHKTGRYISDEEAKMLDPARRNYYLDFMSLKKEIDALLPKGSTTLHNIIRIRKDYIERIKSQKSIDGIIHETKEALKDKVKRRSDNAETNGEASENTKEKNKSVLTDFSGREVERLPIMFVNSKDGENLDDISEDATSALVAYAYMACNFSAMNNVVGLLELVREKVTERPVQQRAGSKALVNVLKAFGIEVSSELTKSGEATNIVNRMNDWFSSQVYSKYMKDEGEIFGMDIGMLANLSNEVTALNQFALNILSGISNVMTASAMNRIESICGQYFSVKNLAKADTIFWAALPEYLADVGNPVKTSKLALFMEKFNVMQDFESDIRDQEYSKSRFSRVINSNSLYVINNAGELWIQNRAALALGEAYGLRDKSGKPVSLWDSQKVVVDENGVARLVTRDDIYKSDGTLFDEKNDVEKFTRKAKSINQRMNGIYNYEDRNAAQAYAIGRMGLMFRKWIKPSINRRYGSIRYNFDLEDWEEGFYRTSGRFFLQLIQDLKRGQLDIVASYGNLDPVEKANLLRFATEVGQFIVVCAAFAILKDVKDKDDDDGTLAKSWWFNQLLYQTRRLESEIGSQMIINPQMIQEAFNILKSPAACVSTWEGVTNLAQLMVPSNYTKVLQTGRYKGHTKAYKLFWDSPFIPMHRTIYRGLHPQNSLQFYDL